MIDPQGQVSVSVSGRLVYGRQLCQLVVDEMIHQNENKNILSAHAAALATDESSNPPCTAHS